VKTLLAQLGRIPGARFAGRFVLDIAHEWSKDRCGGLAAEIAFWLVLSIFPGLLVFGATLGSLDTLLSADVAARAEAEIVEGINDALGSESGPISDAVSDLFRSPSGGALTIGIVFALFSMSRGFNAVVGALDIAYDIETDRSWFHTRATAIILGIGTVIVGALTITMLFLGPLFGRSGQLGTWFTSTWSAIGPIVAFVALVFWAATIYHVAPLHLTKWRWDVPGAIVAAIFWVGATIGFQLYVDSAIGGSNAILGAVGGVLTMLLWVYVLTIGLLLGAEVNQVIAVRNGVSVGHLERRTIRRSVREAAEATRALPTRIARPLRRGSMPVDTIDRSETSTPEDP